MADHTRRPGVNIKDSPWYARGDGVTDDSAAIQAALDAVAATPYGAKIYFPAGNYIIGTTLTLNPANTDNGRVTLVGAGATVTRLTVPTSSVGLDIGDGITYRRYISLHGIAFTRTAVGTSSCVRMRRVNQCAIRHCAFAGGTRALDLSEANICEIDDNRFGDNVVDAWIYAANSTMLGIRGNYFERSAQAGDGQHIHLAPGCDNAAIVGNRFSTGLVGVELSGGASDDVIITGNTFLACDIGIRIASGARGIISGNALNAAGAAAQTTGVLLDGGTDCVVTGNAIAGYTTPISDNAFLGTQMAGNSLDATPSVNRVSTETALNGNAVSALRLAGVVLNLAAPDNLATIQGGYAGQVLSLFFANGNATLTETGNILLATGATFNGVADQSITLMCDGTNWREIARAT